MKVAIVGGTGAFGRALAARLRDLGLEVAVGSRDHQRGWERGVELGVQGGGNEEVVRDADLVVLAVKSNAAIETGRELADAIGDTPVLCVASDLAFTENGVAPGREERSLAEELAEVISAPVASRLQSVSAAELSGTEPLDQDALICGDDARAKEPALEVARARGDDRGDPERQPTLPGTRGAQAHRPPGLATVFCKVLGPSCA